MKPLNYKQGSKEWLQMRKLAIGASDAPIILGVSPYKTKEELLHEKLYGIDQKETAAMTYGKENEEPARQLFEQMSGIVMFPDKVYAHDTREWQIASLDGIDLEGENILEIKCANKTDHQIALEKKVPAKYMPQLQHQMSVCDVKGAYYFSYHKGEGCIVYVDRDDDFIDSMVKEEKAFYEKMMDIRCS